MKKICFRIDGEWLTDIARTLWADDDEPQKALNILNTLVGPDGQEVSEEIALRILTGKGKLVGNSSDGIELKEDNTTVSKHGNLLSLQARMRHLNFKGQESSFEITARNQVASGTVRFMASPWGPVYVPRCAWEKIVSGAWGWESLRPYIIDGSFPQDIHDLNRRVADSEEELETEEERLEMDRMKAARTADEDAKDYVTTLARVGFTNESVVDRFCREQREMEENTGFPTPAKDVFSDNGWIAPNGDFFTCGMIQHDALAEKMGSDTATIERTHVRISTNMLSGYRSPLQFVGRRLTQKQKDKIWDWCECHKVDVPPWVFGDEGTKFSS